MRWHRYSRRIILFVIFKIRRVFSWSRYERRYGRPESPHALSEVSRIARYPPLFVDCPWSHSSIVEIGILRCPRYYKQFRSQDRGRERIEAHSQWTVVAQRRWTVPLACMPYSEIMLPNSPVFRTGQETCVRCGLSGDPLHSTSVALENSDEGALRLRGRRKRTIRVFGPFSPFGAVRGGRREGRGSR